MKYFQDRESGEVLAYEVDGSQDALIRPGLVELSPEEVAARFAPKSAPLSRSEVEAQRRAAYADPLTGSDPLYIEYQRDVAVRSSAEVVEAARQAWLDRAAEIAAQHPWPEL